MSTSGPETAPEDSNGDLALASAQDRSDNTLTYAPLSPNDFEPETLVSLFRTMLLSRRLDEKMVTLLKQGYGHFHIGAAGHEACQAAIGHYLKSGYDWFCMYYRDQCQAIMQGLSSRDLLLAHLAKADDPNSGGRQMPEHFTAIDKNILPSSSSVGSQFLPALGTAMAAMRGDDDRISYVSCGDGATSQGDFHEALNWATNIKAPVLFVVQDNGYAISVPTAQQTAGGSAYGFGAGYPGLKRIHVDGTDFFQTAAAAKAAVEYVRGKHGPLLLVADVVRLMPHSSSDNHTKYRPDNELSADRQRDPLGRFELALIEAGVLTEATAEELKREVHEQVDADAEWGKQQADPAPETAAKHVFYEGDIELDYEASEPAGEPIVMVDAINHALVEEMERDERIIVYGEDVGYEKGGVFTATRNLTQLFGPDRCFNSPLAEASVIGTAVGFAAAGYRPVVEIQFADYIWPAMQQFRNQLTTFRYRSNGQWGCPVVVRVPCGGYINGGLCHSQNIETFFSHSPGIYVVMPSTAADAKGLLKTALRMEDPVLFLEHKALYRAAKARTPEPDADYMVPFGKAKTVHDGADLTVITYGMMVHKSVTMAKQIAKEDGATIEVIDLRSLMPLDEEAILASVRKTNRALIVHEDHKFLGYGAEIAAQIADLTFEHLDAPVRRVAGAFSPVPFAASLESNTLPQDGEILQAMRDLLAY